LNTPTDGVPDALLLLPLPLAQEILVVRAGELHLVNDRVAVRAEQKDVVVGVALRERNIAVASRPGLRLSGVVGELADRRDALVVDVGELLDDRFDIAWRGPVSLSVDRISASDGDVGLLTAFDVAAMGCGSSRGGPGARLWTRSPGSSRQV
jgi:hypothetical protein